LKRWALNWGGCGVRLASMQVRVTRWRGVVVFVAVLSLVGAATALAATRKYSGSISGGGTITIKATFEGGEASKVKITWSDVPTTCDASTVYASTTSGSISGVVVRGVAAAPTRSFYPTHQGFSGSGIQWGVSGRFNKSFSSAKGFFTWQDIQTDPSDPTGGKATCNLVQGGNPATEQNFAVTAG
jgi:hypothetical protein